MIALSNPPGFQKYLKLSEHVYGEVKKVHPDLPVFVTIQIDHYRKHPKAQEKALRQLLQFSDLIAVSCYPHMEGHTPESLPKDWFASIAKLDPSKPFAIAETGYPGKDVHVNAIPPFFPNSSDFAADEQAQTWYTRFILEESSKLNAEFVVWFFARDFDAHIEAELKEGNRMMEFAKWWQYTGLVDRNGTSREALGLWNTWFKLPVQ